MMKLLNPRIAFPILAVAIIAALLILLTGTFELDKPDIRTSTSIGPVGKQKTLEILFSDNRSGLKHLEMIISQDNQSHTLLAMNIPEKGILERKVSVEINPSSLNLHDGEATVTISATDHSLFGNRALIIEKVNIDMAPPRISLLSTAHNISPGGSGLVVFSVSKDVEKCGIRFGEDFYEGLTDTIGGKKAFIAYFPVPLSASRGDINLSVYAKDKGGNEVSMSLPFHLKPRTFKKDVLDLSEQFLSQKMPEFQQREPRLQGMSPVDVFIQVNEKMREENFKDIQNLSRKTSRTRLWKGSFLRMKNAAPMAGFGDVRTYTYQKKSIGGSVHLGVDLASTAHAPIESANSGVVLFTGYLGIYGNTVIVDHGQGIMSLYAHMNEIRVQPGQKVSREEVIGTSGSTGLAGGDHLHFSMIVGGRFVNPVEWWDPHWIRDNVELKLSEAT